MSGNRARNDKRKQILAAATRVFARKGFFHSKVSEIAQQAGVADGTIYLYFKNKDDLLVQLFEDAMDRILSGVRATLEGATGVRQKIHLFIAHHLQLVQSDRDLAEIITVELRQSHKFMKEYANPKFGEYLQIFANIVQEGQELGEIKAEINPRVVSRALFGALNELFLYWLMGRGKFTLDEAIRNIDEMLFGGLFVEHPSPSFV